MTILVTGSSGHLGEGLMRLLKGRDRPARGLDLLAGPYTDHIGSITDGELVRDCLRGASAIVHTATLHKPHVATHGRQAFIETNITGTLVLLEEALAAGIKTVIFTSTTSTFGAALTPPPGAPAAWIDETVTPVPKNIYGVTKTAAEDLCELFHRRHGLNCIILRTARFFPEEDDNRTTRETYADENAKANEFLFRRVDLEDAASAHIAALDRAADIGFGRYIISATTPFTRDDLPVLQIDPEPRIGARYRDFHQIYRARGYVMFPGIDRVYVNAKARQDLGWRPVYDFGQILAQLAAHTPIGSPLARQVGRKGYHAQTFRDGPYPVD